MSYPEQVQVSGRRAKPRTALWTVVIPEAIPRDRSPLEYLFARYAKLTAPISAVATLAAADQAKSRKDGRCQALLFSRTCGTWRQRTLFPTLE